MSNFLFNILVLLYNTIPTHDFGVAIVILTIIIRLIFSPLSIKMLRSQRQLSQLQPKLKELQEKHKSDKQALAGATMALYKEHKVNPFSGCLPILIQIPILFALYSAFNLGFTPDGLNHLYDFVSNPGVIKQTSLGFIDLASKSAFLAVVAGVLQWFQGKKAFDFQNPNPSAKTDQMAMMSKQMLYFSPVMVIIISWNLPTGITIYWITTTLYAIVEQLYINKKYSNVNPRSNN